MDPYDRDIRPTSLYEEEDTMTATKKRCVTKKKTVKSKTDKKKYEFISKGNKDIVPKPADPSMELIKKADKVENADDLYLFQCSKCGNIHFRHAGYVENLMPFARPDKTIQVQANSYCVKVCTKCKSCFIYIDPPGAMKDLTKLIDLKAWERTEKKMQKATGPGGDC